MRVSRLSLRNVGPFADATFAFPSEEDDGELFLFEGPNGSGKTTIAESIAGLVSDDSDGSPIPIKARCRAETDIVLELDHNGTKQNVVFAATGRTFDPPQPPGEGVFPFLPRHLNSEWAAFAYRSHVPSATLATKGPRDLGSDPLAGALQFGQQSLSGQLGQLLVNLEFDRVQHAQYATEHPREEHKFLEIAKQRRAALDRFALAFSKLLDREVTLRFQPGRLGATVLFDGEEIPIDLLGEGLRNTFSFLADLLVRLERIAWADGTRSPWEQEFWLILDEIEASLHPTMQLRILPALRSLFPRARIYATTHSPFVVASAGRGHVFAIRPEASTRRVTGPQVPQKLEPGQSLEWVVQSLFQTPTGIVDSETRSDLRLHEESVDDARAGKNIDWDRFLSRRARLVALNDEVSTLVLMMEAPIRKVVDARRLEAGK